MININQRNLTLDEKSESYIERNFEFLTEYTLNDATLKIENDNPFLTIYVPDWEWLGAFSVNDWDTSNDDVFVGIADNNR